MIGVDPVGDGLVVDREDAPDAPQVHPFEVELDGLCADFIRVAVRRRLGRVDAVAEAAAEALAAGGVEAAFGLLVGGGLCLINQKRAHKLSRSLIHAQFMHDPLNN